jgi:hypothetical protein
MNEPSTRRIIACAEPPRRALHVGRLLALLASGTIVFAAQRAGASETYPEEIQAELALPKAPSCTLCHRDEDGGNKTITRPVGLTFQRFGLTGDDNFAALDAALARARGERRDSDGDGTSDVDELVRGTDPNRRDGSQGPGEGGPVEQPIVPETGCATSPAPSRGLAAGRLCAVALLLGFVLARRRGRAQGAAC